MTKLSKYCHAWRSQKPPLPYLGDSGSGTMMYPCNYSGPISGTMYACSGQRGPKFRHHQGRISLAQGTVKKTLRMIDDDGSISGEKGYVHGAPCVSAHSNSRFLANRCTLQRIHRADRVDKQVAIRPLQHSSLPPWRVTSAESPIVYPQTPPLPEHLRQALETATPATAQSSHPEPEPTPTFEESQDFDTFL